MTASARYLYCVLPADGAVPAITAPALDGGQVHPVRHRDLVALTHACAPEPYRGSETDAYGWIAAHNTVIEEAWKAAGTVLPMSFDVIVRGDRGRSAEENVVDWLAEHHAALRSRLEVLQGRIEVGVQIFRDVEDATASQAGAASEASDTVPGQARPRGHAYFARHQQRRDLQLRIEREAETLFRRHGEMLAALADDFQINRLRPVQGKMMLLNLSLLTDQRGMARVGDYLEQVSKEAGVEVRFTGPWPPYSFAGTFDSLKEITDPAMKLPK